MFDDSDSDSDDDEDDILGYNDLSSQAHRRNRSETLEMLRRRLAQIERDLAPTAKETSGSKHNLPLDDTVIKKNARTEPSRSSVLPEMSRVSSNDLGHKKKQNAQDAK